MFPPDCWAAISKTKTVLEQEHPNASIGRSNIPLVVYFTSDFDIRRAGLWMVKLTDWTVVQRWSDDGKMYMLFSCDFGCIHCQPYFATYCDIWIGNSVIWGICPPEIFKTLHSNFDISRNFQIIELKFCILIILTLWRPVGFGDIRKKTPKRTRLCAGISPVRYALQTR